MTCFFSESSALALSDESHNSMVRITLHCIVTIEACLIHAVVYSFSHLICTIKHIILKIWLDLLKLIFILEAQ